MEVVVEGDELDRLGVERRPRLAAEPVARPTDVAAAVGHGTIQFIGVGTPPDEDGSADMQYVLAAAASIGRHMTDYKVIVDKSTVPVGTAGTVLLSTMTL